MKWLLDEMFPPTAAAELRRLGHDARSVAGSMLAGTDDEHLYELAIGEGRVIVTENFADYASLVAQNLERGASHGLVAFVRKSDLPLGQRVGACARASTRCMGRYQSVPVAWFPLAVTARTRTRHQWDHVDESFIRELKARPLYVVLVDA